MRLYANYVHGMPTEMLSKLTVGLRVTGLIIIYLLSHEFALMLIVYQHLTAVQVLKYNLLVKEAIVLRIELLLFRERAGLKPSTIQMHFLSLSGIRWFGIKLNGLTSP